MSKNIVIYTKPYKFKNYKEKGKYLKIEEKGKVKIGDNVFIMPFVFIQGNCIIGDNVIIKPFSIVTKNIPSNSIYENNQIKRRK